MQRQSFAAAKMGTTIFTSPHPFLHNKMVVLPVSLCAECYVLLIMVRNVRECDLSFEQEHLTSCYRHVTIHIYKLRIRIRSDTGLFGRILVLTNGLILFWCK
jgi:hypothetical protein